MDKEYFSSGQFAKMAHVTKKTLRYYDDHNILKPSFVAENGNKYYSNNDFAKLQQIIFLKYLSFPLADIKELTVRNADQDFWLESLDMQTSLLEEHIEQLSLMKKSLQEAREAIEQNRDVNWSDMLLLANANEMEEKLKRQYNNSSNISARITLHNLYSENNDGWFKWLFSVADIKSGERVLELGCGDGAFWSENKDMLPKNISVLISDISFGILRDTEKKLGSDIRFTYKVLDACDINLPDNSMDVVIANHMLFYCPRYFHGLRRNKTCVKVRRALDLQYLQL